MEIDTGRCFPAVNGRRLTAGVNVFRGRLKNNGLVCAPQPVLRASKQLSSQIGRGLSYVEF